MFLIEPFHFEIICWFTSVREPFAPVNAHDDIGDREHVPLFNLEVEPVSADTVEYPLQAFPADVHLRHYVLVFFKLFESEFFFFAPNILNAAIREEKKKMTKYGLTNVIDMLD